MSDLPTPQDADETALFSACWDAVLSYADLCTSGSMTARQLADEAFTLGVRRLRAEGTAVRGPGRRPARLPVVPELLTAVRETAAEWENAGKGQGLDPGLRLWLNSDAAARYSGPPLTRPIALRGLRDMPEADATLLWLAEVEALPLSVVARRLGLDPQTVGPELDQVRVLFRDRCHRAHRDTPLDAECRSYARLLDAVTRSPGAEEPDDLSRHLATCVPCAEAAACLRLTGGALPAALAAGVVGWGGLAYLERRRRAAEVRLGAGVPGRTGPGDPDRDTSRSRVVRGGLLAAAGLISVVALGASLMPFGTSDGDEAAAHDDQHPVAAPSAEASSHAPSRSAAPATTRTVPVSPTPSDPKTRTRRASPTPKHRDSASATVSAPAPGPTDAASHTPTCHVAYHLDDEWSNGFQATLTVTTDDALTDWQLAWTFDDGQRIGQTWDATPHQSGSQVTASAKSYNKSVAAHGSFAFGFVGTHEGANDDPRGFTLNGDRCDVK
ncbi:cellulose-binding domain-containing protein [Streptomyces sp. LaPpAH-108]|uniref:cellulose-binding domain-containing protein n=1 Tax=Streptomyces sp. LaPpAH-108 TaxID=1155714 RepID=UPI0003717D98|nr:cellulose-binding domain-containing protein [Streptomyces sp. LaPpAH-108]